MEKLEELKSQLAQQISFMFKLKSLNGNGSK